LVFELNFLGRSLAFLSSPPIRVCRYEWYVVVVVVSGSSGELKTSEWRSALWRSADSESVSSEVPAKIMCVLYLAEAGWLEILGNVKRL